MEKKLQAKLAKYGVLVAAISSVQSAEGQVIYTDETPDFAGASGSQYFLDLNNDGTNDFRIWHNSSNNLYVSPLGPNNNVLGSGGATFAYPFALNNGTTISSGAGTFFNNGFSGGFQSLNYGSSGSFGNFISVTDRYLGFQFNIGANVHYGWARLDVNASGSIWAVKDYAYNATPGAAILTGEMSIAASGIVGTDVANNGNGLDLQVDFNPGVETTLSEYRMIAVPTASAAAFTLTDAQALAATSYVPVIPTGAATYTELFTATTLDSDGNAIVGGQAYSIFILSIANIMSTSVDIMSNSAMDVTLMSVIVADTAAAIIGSDVANNGNGLDLQVDFNPGVETTLSEYRMIAVPTASVATFTLAGAQALAATSYVSVMPTGATTYTELFTATTLDSDGNAIVNGQAYSIFILSIANTVNTTIDAMNNSATDVTLINSVVAETANSIVGSDVDNNSNGLDLQIAFNAATNENTIGEYRAIAVPTASAATFTLAVAQALIPASYTSVSPTGAANYTELFTATSLDSDGNVIVEGQAYFMFVLSIADGVNAGIDAINNSITSVTLINNTPADIAGTIVGTDIGDNGDGTDLQIDFNAGASEATLVEYRMIAVPTASAAAFTLATAQALIAANYVSVLPTGAATYTELFTATTLDSDGNVIVEGQAYSIFILSIADGVNGVVDAINNSATDITLISTVGINEYISKEIKAYSTNNGITVSVPNHLLETSINASLYSIEGKLVKNITLTENTTIIQTNDFSSSVYILNLIDKKGNTQSIKIMK